MTQLGIILILLVRIYTWVLIARIIIEMIQSFSRQFNPPRWFMVVAEPLFVITDPPVKALRRLTSLGTSSSAPLACAKAVSFS